MTVRKISANDLSVINAIMTAYMACNSAGGPLEYESTPTVSGIKNATAMGFLSDAGRRAWKQLGMPEKLWEEMVNSGSDADYVFRLFNSENPFSAGDYVKVVSDYGDKGRIGRVYSIRDGGIVLVTLDGDPGAIQWHYTHLAMSCECEMSGYPCECGTAGGF